MEIVRIVWSLWTWHEAGSRITWRCRLWEFLFQYKNQIHLLQCFWKNCNESIERRSRRAGKIRNRGIPACLQRVLKEKILFKGPGHLCRIAPRFLFWIVYKNDVAATWPLVFKIALALQLVLVLCLFWVQKRNLADLKYGVWVSKLALDLDLNFY